MIGESNQRIYQIGTRLARLAIDGRKAKNRADSLFPFAHDRIEVLVDDFGDVGASLQALGLIAVDRAEETLKQLIDSFEMKPNRVELLGRALHRGIGRNTF